MRVFLGSDPVLLGESHMEGLDFGKFVSQTFRKLKAIKVIGSLSSFQKLTLKQLIDFLLKSLRWIYPFEAHGHKFLELWAVKLLIDDHGL